MLSRQQFSEVAESRMQKKRMIKGQSCDSRPGVSAGRSQHKKERGTREAAAGTRSGIGQQHVLVKCVGTEACGSLCGNSLGQALKYGRAGGPGQLPASCSEGRRRLAQPRQLLLLPLKARREGFPHLPMVRVHPVDLLLRAGWMAGQRRQAQHGGQRRRADVGPFG